MTIINILLSVAIWNLLMSMVNKQKTNYLHCGIIGFSGKTNFDKNKITQLMMWNAFSRGTDATGIFSPKNGLVKTVDAAPHFLIKNPLKLDKILMAHVRAATVGNKDDPKNAHPFQSGNITLLHNGTLKNHWPIMRKNDLKWADHDVDSQVVCSVINKNQNFDVLKEIDGAAAMLINNKDTPEILYVYRNKERPLFKGTINGNMYISSIDKSLELIGAKNIKEFKENMLYKIKDGIILSKVEIINTPYVEPPIPGANTHEVYPLAVYLNTWLMLDKNLDSMDLTQYENYLIEGFESRFTKFTVKNDKGEYVEVNKYDFYYNNEAITTGKYVKTTVPLTYGSGVNMKNIAKVGDIFFVLDDKYTGSVQAKHFKTGQDYHIGKNFLSRLTIKEEGTLLELIQKKEEDIVVPEQVSINFDDISSFQTTDVQALNDEIDEDTPIDADENEIIEVNQKQLVEDFSFIDAGLDDIYEEIIKLVPDEKKRANFINTYNILQTKINDCKEQYEIEFETN